MGPEQIKVKERGVTRASIFDRLGEENFTESVKDCKPRANNSHFGGETGVTQRRC